MAVSQSLTLTQQSQNIVNNSSVVKMLWTSTQSGESRNGYTRTANYWVSINGGTETKYSVTYTLPKNSTTTIAEVSITVPHNSDGTGSISVRTWMDTDIYEGVITKTASLTLTKIPRLSTLTVANGELGVEQGLTINKADSSFTHRITWWCTGHSGVISEKTSATTLKFTIPEECADATTTGDDITVWFYCSTSTGTGEWLGQTAVSATFHIPDKFAPYFLYTKTDANSKCAGMGFVQGQSKLKLDISGAASSYGASIKSYKTVFDGKVYTGASFVSDPIVNSGYLSVTISVTDSRNRTTSKTDRIYVNPYQYPKITRLKATRCDSNGTYNTSGEYIRVEFAYDGESFDGANPFVCTVKAKKASGTSYSIVWAEEFDEGSTSEECIFDADPASSYGILLTVSDTFKAIEFATVAGSAKKVFSLMKKNGDIVGMAFNKAAEHEGYFEIGMPLMLSGGGDTVVEYGEKDGWTYRKWQSGIAECWKRLEYTTTLDKTWGSLYCGTSTPRQNYPLVFVSTPVEVVTMQNSGYAAWLCAESGGSGGVNGGYATAQYMLVRPTAGTTSHTFYINYHITGKWK